ncbi:MAG: C40 family peptidase [Erythrobacter sp.]|nr:C40 family peptidase [Erythrobacter sp.]
MDFARAAEALMGVPFRFRGGDPDTGLDCIGLVRAALLACGRQPPSLPPYAMRNLDPSRLADLLPQAGFTAAQGAAEPGDLLLLQPSAAQFHLAIVGTQGQLVHAHGGLGRVVASPSPLPWPMVARWRLRPS